MYFFVVTALFWLLPLKQATGTWKCSTCSISYEAVGCYQDNNYRPLPTEILNERDRSRDIFEGNVIDWFDWDNYMGRFACRCAAKAKARGWTVFGLQFYGECWSGPEPIQNLSMVESDDCVGQGYKKCNWFDRHCVGKQFTNMVYRIVPECEIKFERLGCNNDPHIEPRPLPDYILTDRDSAHSVSSGRTIDWRNWDAYLPEFACRCAKKAKEEGYDTFGLQYYGECWSGNRTVLTYNNEGPSPNCVNKCFESCTSYNKYCVGKQFTNFVYRLSDAQPQCEISWNATGCFNESMSNRALDIELVNEIYAPSTKFNGIILDNQNWNEEFPKFLCRCARAAKNGGYSGFGVNNYGSCWTAHNLESYDETGSECFSNFQNKCTPGDSLCAGGPDNHFVYTI